MKALKEKRISLRSLWRRGLVILSLFALVFASCAEADSGGGGGDIGGGRVPIGITILNSPTVTSYEGLPIDLTGLNVMVRYSNDPLDYDLVKGDDPKLSTNPAYAYGAIGVASGITTGTASGLASGINYQDFRWFPVNTYDLLLQVGNDTFTGLISVGVQPIIRSDSQTPGGYNLVDNYGFYTNGYSYNSGQNTTDSQDYYWAQGLQLTGPLGESIYIDDYPNLSALTLQAHYVNGEKKQISLTKLPAGSWELRARNQNASGPGDLFVTIGATPNGGFVPNYAAGFVAANGVLPRGADAGVTVTHKYDRVHIVKRDGLEVIFPAGGELDNFFYWQGDSGPDWVDRLIGKGASVKVTYTDDTTKTFTVQEAVRMNDVWRNYAPDRNNLIYPFGVSGVFATAAGTTHAKNKNPRIAVNYRGGVTYLPVKLYTKFASLEVLPVTGDAPVPMDMKHSDNDVGGASASLFAGKINVNAYFTSAADPDLPPASVRLTFLNYTGTNSMATALTGSTYTTNPTAHQVDSTVTIDVPVVNQGAPYYQVAPVNGTYYGARTHTGAPADGTSSSWPNWTQSYTMNFGVHDTLPGNSTLSEWSKDGWGPCANPKNNGKDTAITIYYRAPFNNTDLATNQSFEPAHWGVTSASAKSQKITVSWSNIRVK